MTDLYSLAKPFVFKMDPEKAHTATLKLMKAGLVPGCPQVNDPALGMELFGLTFPNPVGLAAGFDKNAEVVGPALDLGFGFVEAGTVTPKPQAGNPKPRIFRDPENEAVINRMGFPNGGLHLFKSNLDRFRKKNAGKNTRSTRDTGIVGINIGMNKDQSDPAKDYTALVKILAPMADYLTVNISSPNTPGLRDLQKREFLLELLDLLKAERKSACAGKTPPALLVKFAPDLSDEQMEELAQSALDGGVDGIILTNTTLDRPDYLPEKFRQEKGGLSGRPLTQKSTAVIKRFYTLTQGKIPIIGVGGISSGQDAYDKIKAGASLVQLYSSLVFKGPNVAHSINTELRELLKQDGLPSIKDAVGRDASS